MSWLDDVLDTSELEIDELMKLERPEHLGSTGRPGGASSPRVLRRSGDDQRVRSKGIRDPRVEPAVRGGRP